MSFNYLVVYTKEIHFTYMHSRMSQIRSHFSRSEMAVYIRTISGTKMNTDMIHFGNAEMAADIQTISSPHLAIWLLIWLFWGATDMAVYLICTSVQISCLY
jgi:hypothetical protein